MVQRRGSRVSFSASPRAIVREAEWMVDMARVATELRPLMKAAKDQGWTLTDSNGSKLVWRGPNGEGPVYTGYRVNGRDLANYAAELRRNGLKLDDEHNKKADDLETAEALIEIGESVTVQQIIDAMSIVNGGISVLVAKAENFETMKAEIQEYDELTRDASKEIEQLKAKVIEYETKLDAIHAAFNLAGWAVLPEIAKILNIDPTKQVSLPMRSAG